MDDLAHPTAFFVQNMQIDGLNDVKFNQTVSMARQNG